LSEDLVLAGWWARPDPRDDDEGDHVTELPRTRRDVTVPDTGRALDRRRRRTRTEELLERLRAGVDPDRRRELTDALVLTNMGVAEAVASRYRARGIATEDLQQVAYLALVKAANSFDVTRGADFLAYAVPTIRGEVRRHFRDAGWAVRPPRRIQDLQRAASRVRAELSAANGCEPSARDLAEVLGVSEQDIREALGGGGCFAAFSLDRPVEDEGSLSVGDLIPDGREDSAAAEARAMLGPLVRRLGRRDREILRLRFFHGLTQQEMADVLGVTQVQVSRLLSRIYADLRRQLGSVPPESLAS
jgi:RNA polymerase sigma-B factor